MVKVGLVLVPFFFLTGQSNIVISILILSYLAYIIVINAGIMRERERRERKNIKNIFIYVLA